MTLVSYRVRFTRNMGNFESLQLEIGVEDGERGEEKVEEAYNRVKDFVEEKLLDEIEELEKQILGVREAAKNGVEYKRKVKSAAESDK